eukprot:TRINITY_DN13360_c0_g1_i1.p1 TRINITY_DN13360_c0_g1~~TRINITY_DN13360_c0_g1_i1.p1  ORF type:complete len:129 (-),score=23.04 TRINITY_DN13360_c0_g1_i1:1-387(-)
MNKIKTLLFQKVVPNTGSVARDMLANERTFLAWTRTSLSFMGLGIALETVSPDVLVINDKKKRIASLTCVGIGGVFLAYSMQRYIQVLVLLNQGKFRPNVTGVLGLVAVFSSVFGSSLYYLDKLDNLS